MMRRAFALVLLVAFALPALGISLMPIDIECPICGTHAKTFVLTSWGSYACRGDGELDLVPCPIVYTSSLWTCAKCKFTIRVEDVASAKARKDRIRAYLDKLPPSLRLGNGDMLHPDDESFSDRLSVAEGVYEIVGRDGVFWSEFYRSAGYFAASEHKIQRAAELRRKGLGITEALLTDPRRANVRMEDFLAAGALAAKLGETEKARRYLRQVRFSVWDPPNYQGASDVRRDLKRMAVKILGSLN
jgi:hypothetical protein